MSKKKQEPATLEDLRLQYGLLQVMTRELETRVKDLEQRNSELVTAVNGLTAVIGKMQATTPTPEEVQV